MSNARSSPARNRSGANSDVRSAQTPSRRQLSGLHIGIQSSQSPDEETIPLPLNPQLSRSQTPESVRAVSEPPLREPVRYQLWLRNCAYEGLFLIVVALAHIALLVQDVLLSSGNAALIAGFAVYDLIQLFLIAFVAWKVSHAIHKARMTPRQLWHAESWLKDPRAIDVPPFLSSRPHILLVAAIAVLAACRFAFADLMLCPEVGQSTQLGSIAQHYQPCRTIEVGGYPFPGLGGAIIVMGVYAWGLSLTVPVLVAATVFSYAFSFGVEVSLNYATTANSEVPLAADTTTILLLGFAALAKQMLLGRAKISSWNRERALMIASADNYKACLAAMQRESKQARARLAWKGRIEVATEMVYERMSAYSAHEMRNPLHVLEGTLCLASHRIEALRTPKETSPENITSIVEGLTQDCSTIAARTSAMKRIVQDLTDFWLLRNSVLQLNPTKISAEGLIRKLNDTANSFDACCNLLPSVSDHTVPPVLIADVLRMQQMAGDLMAHAVASAAVSVPSYVMAVDMEAVWPLHERCYASGSDVSSPINESEEYRHALELDREAPEYKSLSSGNVTQIDTVLSQGSISVGGTHDDDAGHGSSSSGSSHRRCMCDFRARFPASHEQQSLNRQWICIIVTAEGVLADPGLDALVSDPVSVFVHRLVERETPTALSPPRVHDESSTRNRVRGASLSLAVAKMLSRRLGGDMIIVEGPHDPLASPGSQITMRYYMVMVPLVHVSGSDIMTVGLFHTWCPHCHGDLKSYQHMQASTALFGPSGRIPKAIWERLRQELCKRITGIENERKRTLPSAAGESAADVASLTAAVAGQEVLAVVPVVHTPPIGRFPRAPSWHDALERHILYVEDETVNRRLMERFLRRIGCTYTIVKDGVFVASTLVQAGMVTREEVTGLPWEMGGITETSDEASATTPYDVIIMDIVMPLSDGADICHGLRALGGRWTTIPIIAATGNAPDDVGLLRSGFTMVLRKPFTLEHLREAIQEVCAVREPETQLRAHGAQHDAPG